MNRHTRTLYTVNGVRQARVGAVVVYKVTLVIGATPIADSKVVYLETGVGDAPMLTACTNATGSPVAIPVTGGMATGAALVCIFTRVVTAADIVAGPTLSGLTVTARTADSATTLAGAATLTSPGSIAMPAVQVFTSNLEPELTLVSSATTSTAANLFVNGEQQMRIVLLCTGSG